MTKYKLINAEKQEGIYYILTVEHIPGLVGKLFGEEPKEIKYYGNGTVWHQMPLFKRCSTPMEGLLADYYTRVQYEEKQRSRE